MMSFRIRIRKGMNKRVLALFIAVVLIFTCNMLSAAEMLGKYQVVAGKDDKAYLVDTSTGAVWILTYRSIATGREPIAIPYKFIKISPKNQHEFLVESATGASMSVGEFK